MMSKYFVIALALSLGLLMTSAGAAIAQDEEIEYSYGTVNKVSGNEIEVAQYDYEDESDVSITYTVSGETQFINVNGVSEISPGDTVDIDYVVEDGKYTAKVVDVEKAAAETPGNEEAPAEETPGYTPEEE